MNNIELYDDNNRKITISNIKSSYSLEITWYCFEDEDQGVKRQTKAYYRSFNELDIKFVRNFTFAEVDGIILMIEDKPVYILKEHVIKGVINNNRYEDVKLVFYGLVNNRKLSVSYPITHNFYHECITYIDNDTELKDIEYHKVLCHPQDMPHGVSLKIKGVKTEILRGKGYVERTLEMDKADLCELINYEILHNIGGKDDQVKNNLKILKNLKLLSILKTNDSGTFNLLKNIDNLTAKLEMSDKNLVLTREELDKKTELLKKSDLTLQEALSKIERLESERSTFKKTIKDNILNVLNLV